MTIVSKNIKIKAIESTEIEPVGSRNKREVYNVNPFLNFTVTANKKQMTVSKGTIIKSVNEEDDTEDEYTTTISQVRLVDSEQFIKLFSSQIASIFELTSAGIKMFGILLVEVQNTIGGDSVYLTPAIVSKIAKSKGKTLSSSTFTRGVNDLIESKIIAASALGAGWYFLNPTILFNGDRAKFVTEYRKVDVKKVNANQAVLNFTASEPEAEEGEE